MKKDKFIVNRSEMELGKSSAVDVVEPTRTHGSQDVEKNLFSNNNRDFAVQNDAEEPILEPTGTVTIINLIFFFLGNRHYNDFRSKIIAE